MIISSVWLTERLRILHCQGCKYLGLVGSNGCCNYYLHTDNRRPNPFGVKDCKVKVLVESPTAVERVVRQTLSDKETYDRRVKETAPKWDIELGEKMFAEGHTIKQIAAAVCRSEDTVYNYARRHGWKKRGLDGKW